jgi:uncharacterized protein involved in exopolysaccharide biosynthesis/Mrp family chromosome partitioning ATPase
MNAKPTGPHAPGLTLGDIYYILFRHKWKVLALSVVGFIAALALPRLSTKVYQSEAELLIRYVTEMQAPIHPGANDAAMKAPEDGSGSVLNTEIQILTSFDLAQEVAKNLGPEKILGKGGSDPYAAANAVHSGLSVDVPNKSDVIRIVFRSTDPTIIQPVLQEVIKTYLEKHQKIHNDLGEYSDFLTKQTDDLKNELKTIEESLRNAKTNGSIGDTVAEARQQSSAQISRIQQELYDADVELAEHQAVIAGLSQLAHPNGASTNTVGHTNLASTAAATTNDVPVPPEKLSAYHQVCDLLDRLHKKEQDLLVYYQPEYSLVRDVREQIVSTEKHKKQLETETPGLIAAKAATSVAADGSGNESSSALRQQLMAEASRVAALDARISTLTNELAEIKDRAALVDASEPKISELERNRGLAEDKLKYYLTQVDRARVDSELGPGKVSNITVIENPFPPFLDSAKVRKLARMLCLGGIAAGLALAFLMEMYVDRSIKRPIEVEARLGYPLLLTIPYRNGKAANTRLLKAPAKTALVIKSADRSVVVNGSTVTIGRAEDNTLVLTDGSISGHHCEVLVRDGEPVVKDLGSANGTFVNGQRVTETVLKSGQVLRVGQLELQVASEEVEKPQEVTTAAATWNPRHALRPFYDALRDRLITYFEVKGLTHKPKLVAVTSCGQGVGVTSTATGLAAALSETGEGNVLLVDMNEQNGGAAHYFHKGRLAFGLDDALQKDKRREALVKNNLYVVKEGTDDDNLAPLIPKRFTNLVPQLKASDYDYIIFDMPPVSQISVTPRLARFMDMMLIVVESEKTDRDVVQRAAEMLTEARGHVGIVLNKWKNYVPRRIQQEL